MFNFKKDAEASHPTSGKPSDGLDEVTNKDSISTGGLAMIGSKVVIEGQITSGEDLLIEGNVSGTIMAVDHEVIVGQSGVLKANIAAKTVRIDGTVEGDVSGGEKVIISKTGNVLGNIDAPRVTLEDGAKFKGSIEMDPGDQNIVESPIKGLVGGSGELLTTDGDSVEKSKVS